MNDAQVRAVESLAEEYDYGNGTIHAHKVADLATSLFDQLELHALLPGSSMDDRRTLTAAAYAHDIGVSVRAHVGPDRLPHWAQTIAEPDRHGEVAFHLLRCRIRDASPGYHLATLGPGDRSLLLYCLLWHASSAAYVLDIEPVFDRQRALLLAGILRIADGLDCERRLRVRDIQVQKASVWLRLLVRSVAPVTEEIARAREKANMLAQALGLRIFVQEIVES